MKLQKRVSYFALYTLCHRLPKHYYISLESYNSNVFIFAAAGITLNHGNAMCKGCEIFGTTAPGIAWPS